VKESDITLGEKNRKRLRKVANLLSQLVRQHRGGKSEGCQCSLCDMWHTAWEIILCDGNRVEWVTPADGYVDEDGDVSEWPEEEQSTP
jgi:hypothetical protein